MAYKKLSPEVIASRKEWRKNNPRPKRKKTVENVLTPKMAKIAALLRQGCNNVEIADTLNNSADTIGYMCLQMRKRFNAKTQAHLIERFYQTGYFKLNNNGSD